MIGLRRIGGHHHIQVQGPERIQKRLCLPDLRIKSTSPVAIKGRKNRNKKFRDRVDCDPIRKDGRAAPLWINVANNSSPVSKI